MQNLPYTGHTLERRFRCGLGQCRLCSCPAFKGQGNRCEDCGHHYDDHTTKPFLHRHDRPDRHRDRFISS
jgi:hypothetical protein